MTIDVFYLLQISKQADFKDFNKSTQKTLILYLFCFKLYLNQLISAKAILIILKSLIKTKKLTIKYFVKNAQNKIFHSSCNFIDLKF
jgi:hypothetical protein